MEVSTLPEASVHRFLRDESDGVVAQDLLQQGTNHTILVTPLRLHVITDAIRLGLKELALILSLSIYPIQRDDQ